MAPAFLSHHRPRESTEEDLFEVFVDAPGSDVAWSECLRDMKRTLEGGSVSIIGSTECTQITPGKSGLIAGDMSRQACSSALEVLKSALQKEMITHSDAKSPCDSDKLALAVARHISVGPGLEAVMEQKLPAALWQPTFAVCVSPTQVRVLLLAYAGSPVFGDRPSSKTAPYLLKVLTDNLLPEEAAAGDCVKEQVRARYCLLKAPDRVTSVAQHLELMQPLIVSAASDGEDAAWIDCLTAQTICQQSSFASSMSSVRSSSLMRNLSSSAKAYVAPSLSSNSTNSRTSRAPQFGDRAARLRSAFERAQSPSVNLQQQQQSNRPPKQPPQTTTIPTPGSMETTTSSKFPSFSSTASGQQPGPVAAAVATYAFNSSSLSTSSATPLAATTTQPPTNTTLAHEASFTPTTTALGAMSAGTSMSSWCKVGAPPPAAASARASSRSGTPTTTTTMAASPSPSSSASSLPPSAPVQHGAGSFGDGGAGGSSSSSISSVMGQSISAPLSKIPAAGGAGGADRHHLPSSEMGMLGRGLAPAPAPAAGGMGGSATLGHTPPSTASLESCHSRENQPTCSRFLSHAGARSPPPRRPPPHKARNTIEEPPRPSVSVLADGLSVKSVAGLWNNLATSTSGWWQSQRGSMTPPVPRKTQSEARGSTSVVDRRSRMHATLSAGTPDTVRPLR